MIRTPYLGDKIKKDEMSRAYGRYGVKEKYVQGSGG